MNFTDVPHTLQSFDYRYVFSNLIGPAQLELLAFTICMSFYAIFVWVFYKTLSKRDIFKLDLSKYDITGEKFLYVLKYGIVFPFYVSFWFVILSLFMFILTKEISVIQITLISMALVSTIRVTSYLKEELSIELAKLMPFALLAIFLVEPNFFSWNLLIARLQALPSFSFELLQCLVFAILLEWILRILYSVKLLAREKLSSTNEK